MSIFFLALCLFAWWAQRDAYRMGREQGRIDERLKQLEREAVENKKHLTLLQGGKSE